MSEHYCPSCGEEMKLWGQGIYSCEECGSMFDGEVMDEMEGESE